MPLLYCVPHSEWLRQRGQSSMFAVHCRHSPLSSTKSCFRCLLESKRVGDAMLNQLIIYSQVCKKHLSLCSSFSQVTSCNQQHLLSSLKSLGRMWKPRISGSARYNLCAPFLLASYGNWLFKCKPLVVRRLLNVDETRDFCDFLGNASFSKEIQVQRPEYSSPGMAE